MTIICPIGTCRIHTPLRRARNTHDIQWEKSRNYGFTHTAHEALQQLRFILGEIDIPERARKLAFRHGHGGELADEMELQPDHYLIEISSAKNITLDGFAIQVNYFYRQFDDLFSEYDRRQQFSKLAADETRDGLYEWLEGQPAFDRLTPEKQALLKDIRITTDTKDDVRTAIAEILDRVGRDRLIITTHVDALDARGRHLPPREKHVTDVEEACRELDVICYNPTGLMKRLGQNVALKNDGRDLTHFTEKFADALFRDWNAHFFGADALVELEDDEMPGSGMSAADRKTLRKHPATPGFSLARYHRDIEAGKVFEASRDLRSAVRKYPDNYPLLLEQARLDYRLGNYPAALAFYEERGKDGNFSDSDLEAWLVSTYEASDPGTALEVGEMLLADEVESTLIYATVARAAADLGQVDSAIKRWKHLFFQGEAPLEAASEILDLLDQRPDAAARKDEWVALVLERYPEHEDALAVLWRKAIAKRSGGRLLYLLRQSQNISSELALELAEGCCKAELHAIGAQLLASHSEWEAEQLEGSDAETLRAWVNDRRSRWLIEGEEMFEAGDIAKSAQRISAANIVGDGRARQPMRELQRALLTAAREAYKAKNHEQVLQIVDLARTALVEFRQMHLLAGRSHYALQNYERATTHLLQEAAEVPYDSRLAWNIARAAINSEQYSVAIDQLMLIEADEESKPEERKDATERLTRLVGRAVREVRELTADERYDDALRLLEKIARIEGGEERAEVETRRLASALRKQIVALDASQSAKQLDLARRLLAVDPENEFAAKSAAIGAMRTGDFEAAIGYFETMRPLTQNKTQVDRNIAKCQTLLAREAA